jgi:hypothetical protein
MGKGTGMEEEEKGTGRNERGIDKERVAGILGALKSRVDALHATTTMGQISHRPEMYK